MSKTFEIGQSLTTWDDFLDLPVGARFHYREVDSEEIYFKYEKANNHWLSHGGLDFVDPMPIEDGKGYFSLNGENTISWLPSISEPLLGVVTPPDTTAAETPRGEVLLEARSLITGDRNETYGTPTQNFTNIAELWTTLIKHKLKDDEAITPSDVADLMVALKLARNVTKRQRDSYTDMAGYAACGYEAWLSEQEPNED